MMQRPMSLGMMGRIQGTSEWANDPVWINDGWKERDGRDMTRSPPRAYIGWQEENCGTGIRRIAT